MELNFKPLTDNHMAELFYNFSPHFNIPGEEVNSVSGHLTLFDPANNILLEYLQDRQDNPKEDTILKELLA